MGITEQLEKDIVRGHGGSGVPWGLILTIMYVLIIGAAAVTAVVFA